MLSERLYAAQVIRHAFVVLMKSNHPNGAILFLFPVVVYTTALLGRAYLPGS